MEKIGFPGLGLEFEINPTAFTVFGVDVQWYGVIIAIGITLAFLLFNYLGVKKENIVSDTIYNVTLMVVPIAIIGARFFYVVTKWDYYGNKSFFEMINIRGGGLAIYGGIIFGLITILIYNKIAKTSALSMLDALAPAVMLGQAIGRWGNFVNAEAYGWSEGVENLPWRMELEKVYVDGVLTKYKFVHPTFLYESLWNILGLIIILAFLYRAKKFDGEIFFAYMGWYGLGRALIESIRADSLYIVGTLKFSVFVGIVAFIAAIIGEIVLYNKSKTEKEEMATYEPAFASVKMKLEQETDALDQSVFETEAIDEAETDIEEIDEEDIETLKEQDLLDGDIYEIETETEDIDE